MTLNVDQRAPKPPPENPEAEASLLGALLIDHGLYAEVMRGRIAPPDLSRDNHRLVLGAIERVAARGDTISFESVQHELAAKDELGAVGGAQFLVGLMQFVPSVTHAETYATIVARTAQLRRLIGAANEIARLALVREDAKAAVEEAQALLFSVSEGSLHRDITPLDLALRRYAEQIAARGDESRSGIPTGLKTLDAKTGGLQPSDLILVAGRPGLGKTSLALCFVAHAALIAGQTCAIFSLEMSELQLVQRLISMVAEIEGSRIRRGRLSLQELQAISDASARLQQAPIYVEESSRLTVTDILAKSRRLQAEHGRLDLVVIDYLQLIEGVGDDEGRVQEVARISRSLKAIARELEVPVVAVSQLSRQIETRGTEPMLSDLRECVTGDTRVLAADTGTWVPVRDLAPGREVVALGADHRMGRYAVSDVWTTGVRPVYELTSQGGWRIKATDNHPFLTPAGWKPLGALREGDLVATAMRVPEVGSELPDRTDLCRLLGYFVGDGTYRTWGAVGFISSDQTAFDDVVAIIEKTFTGVTPRMKAHTEGYAECDFRRLYANGYGKPYGNPLREWLRALGVHGQGDESKRVPGYVFEAGQVGAANFLAGYLSADGSVKFREVPRKRRRWSVQFDTVNPRLAEDVKALLLGIGTNATIRPGAMNPKRTTPLFRTELCQSAPNLERFARSVPVRGRKGELLARLLDDLPRVETSPGIYALPYEASHHLRSLRAGWKHQGKRMWRSTALAWSAHTGDQTLRTMAHSDVLWERVRSIEAAGTDEVFDLRVPGSGNFMANGFIVHNSGALEADADLVMFLWQKDLQDRKDGVVRLKLAKHRNGPTADIDLHFEAEITRFRDLGETRAIT